MEKTRLDRNIYETTLDYLEDRIALHKQIMKMTRSEKQIRKQQRLIEDCRKIQAFFEESFKPRG